MKKKHQKSAARLDFFRALYENAKNSYAEKLDGFEKCMRQYKGSTEIDGSSERASTVRNITYEIIESQVNSDIPMPKADAAYYSEKRERNAHAIEQLCRSRRDRLPFEEMNDLDERYTYIYGGSVWLVEWNEEAEAIGSTGDVTVHCLSPKDFIPQPGIYEIDDMDYCFLRFTTTRGVLVRKYGISKTESYLAECLGECDANEESDTVAITVCFYRNESGGVGQFIFSSDLILADNEEYYKRRVRYCTVCGRSESDCKCGSGSFEYENLEYEYVPSPDGTDAGVTVSYYTPMRFPIVIRRNTSVEKSLIGQSDCEYIRPEQQAINKIESRILQKLLRAGITPIVPEDASITLNNSVFGQLIKMKPGESTAQYGTVDTTPDISQDIAEAERLYDHAKRTLGISDAYQGISESASESGVARQLRISQASGRLQSKKKMKYTAYAHIDRLIFEHYLAFADEPRILSYKDCLGNVHCESFKRSDFVEYDALRDEYRYDDGYLFSVDLNGANEYQREALWERNLENLRAGTLGDPASPSTLYRYWQAQERAHYPHARENVEYFKGMIGKEGENNREYIGKEERIP